MPHVKRTTGIYCFENKINGKRYIGQALNMERRLYEHEYYLAQGRDKSTLLQRAVNKYGRENFDVYVLEVCEACQMNEREVYWISYYKTNDKRYGNNASAGGNQSMLGYKFPPEVGRKVSMAKKGTKLSEETRKKISVAQKGKVLSEETKRRISAGRSGEKHYLWGKTHTEEAKQRMHDAHSGEKGHWFGKKNKNSSSQYHGVHRMKDDNRTYWMAAMKFEGKRIYIGLFKDELEAARAYDSYVLAHNLPNPLNFPEEKNGQAI